MRDYDYPNTVVSFVEGGNDQRNVIRAQKYFNVITSEKSWDVLEGVPHGVYKDSLGAAKIREKLLGNITDVNPEKNPLPTEFRLYQNYPNPFNPSTKISYSIPNSNFVVLKIYDILGREIQTLVSEFQKADTYSVSFDASKITSGIYFYRLQVGRDFVEARKMLLMR